MAPSYTLSGGFLTTGRPLKPSFGSRTVSLEPKLSAEVQSSRPPLRLRLARCSLGHLDGSDGTLRKAENLQIIRHHDPYFVPESKKLSTVDTLSLLDLSTRLHFVVESVPAPSAPVQTVPIPKLIPPKPRVILIAGPTAVGKTRLSIELAKALGGEIINADSVQVYQGLDIGAAKATMEERQGVPHHLMDVVPPTVEYSYERFLADARAATNDILARGLVPIVIGGTGIYMRLFMHNRPDLTSHPFPGEDLTGEFDSVVEWPDFDFQAYFMYQHRADLFPRVDLRCEQQVLALLEETSWLLDLGVEPHSNSAANAIGYEEAMDLLVDARANGGIVTEERFLKFLVLFQHNCKKLVKKQLAWFRKTSRSEVRQFRWIQGGRPVQEMVDVLVGEYRRPVGKASEVPSGKELREASFKEQKRMQRYLPTLKVYSNPEAVAHALQWIKSTQGSRRMRMTFPQAAVGH